MYMQGKTDLMISRLLFSTVVQEDIVQIILMLIT